MARRAFRDIAFSVHDDKRTPDTPAKRLAQEVLPFDQPNTPVRMVPTDTFGGL